MKKYFSAVLTLVTIEEITSHHEEHYTIYADEHCARGWIRTPGKTIILYIERWII